LTRFQQREENKRKDCDPSKTTYHTVTSETHLGHPTTSQCPSPFVSTSSDECSVQDLRVGLFEEGESGLVFSVGLGFLVRFIRDMFGECGRRSGDRVARKLSGTTKEAGTPVSRAAKVEVKQT